MKRIVRAVSPGCLSANQRFKKKCIRWEARYNANKSSAFAWGRYGNRKMVDLIIDALTPMTQQHCTFCDINKVIKGGVRPTIEHYVPKTVRPLLAYVWANLFLCCHQCQEYKSDNFHKDLVKPDRPNYLFDEYFIIDFASGELQPNPRFPDNIIAASVTIELYGINQDGRPQLRLNEVEAFRNTLIGARIIDNFSYRFFIERS